MGPTRCRRMVPRTGNGTLPMLSMLRDENTKRANFRHRRVLPRRSNNTKPHTHGSRRRGTGNPRNQHRKQSAHPKHVSQPPTAIARRTSRGNTRRISKGGKAIHPTGATSKGVSTHCRHERNRPQHESSKATTTRTKCHGQYTTSQRSHPSRHRSNNGIPTTH